jgi:hypothetical protein
VRIARAQPLQCGALAGVPASWKLLFKKEENNFKSPRLPADRGFFVVLNAN